MTIITDSEVSRRNKYLKGETALLATSNFLIIDNAFFVLFYPPKYMKSHLRQPKISKFSRDHAPDPPRLACPPDAACHDLLDTCGNCGVGISIDKCKTQNSTFI